MPLHFMNFYGSTSMEEVFSTLEYAIYAHDISLICIDNILNRAKSSDKGLRAIPGTVYFENYFFLFSCLKVHTI